MREEFTYLCCRKTLVMCRWLRAQSSRRRALLASRSPSLVAQRRGRNDGARRALALHACARDGPRDDRESRDRMTWAE